MNLKMIKADYTNPKHANSVKQLLNHYASDPMGGGKPLEPALLERVIKGLAQRSYAFSLLAYHHDEAIGLANCFEQFSTFNAKPILNIHDFTVLKSYRGKGIAIEILNKLEEIAQENNCCKITLEVLSNNNVAQACYRKFGFSAYQLNSQTGIAQFWEKIVT